MSASDQEAAEQRVQDAVRRHARARAFTEAEDVISAVLSDPGVQAARARVEAAETGLGIGAVRPSPAVPGPLRPGRGGR